MPGFVDAHTHPVFAGNRAAEFEQRIAGASYAELAASGGGILSTMRETRAATEEQLLAAAQRYASWFHSGGTTTIEAKSGYGLTVEDECKLLRVIRRIANLRCVPTFLGAHEIPDEYRGRASAYADLVIHHMLTRVASERLAEYCDVFCEPGIFSIEESRRVLSAAAFAWAWTTNSCRPAFRFRRRYACGRVARLHGRSSGTHQRTRYPGTAFRWRSTGAASGVCLCPRPGSLPQRARDDRSRPGCCAGHRF